LSKSRIDYPRNYVLRITKEEWYRQVYTIKKYYPGVRRRWDPGGTILLVRKPEKTDSFIGYGIVGDFTKKDQLPEEKRQECVKMGWRGEIAFKELYKFDPPLPIKDTALGGLGAKGKILQGYPLTNEQVQSVLDTAKGRVSFIKA